MVSLKFIYLSDFFQQFSPYILIRLLKYPKSLIYYYQDVIERLSDNFYLPSRRFSKAMFIQFCFLKINCFFYGKFYNGFFLVSSLFHAGCMGFIRASFEQKSSKIGQETAELQPIYQREVV